MEKLFLENYSVDELLEHIAAISEKKLESTYSPEDVVNSAKGRLLNSRIEKLLVYYLDIKNQIIKIGEFKGTVNKAVVYPREVFREALLCDASAIIVIHNHPSKDDAPSGNDIHLTELLNKGLETLDIKLLDHIIIAKAESFFSFARENIL